MAIQDLTASLDLKQNLNIYATCKQFDNLNLILSIFDNSLQADLNNYDVRVRAMKADNVPLIQEHIGININSNIVNIEAHEQLTTVAGNTPIELQFIDKSTGEKKATFNLVLVVVASAIAIQASISKATYTLLEELEKKLDQASDFFEHIGEAIEANTNLENTIANSETAKTNLDGSISAGNTLKTNLNNTISTGNTLKTNLENDISTGNTLKDDLEGTISTGDSLLNSLETFEQEHADVTDISNQLASVNAQLLQNAQQINDVNNALALKADKEDLETTNANVSANTTTLAAKADKNYVDTLIQSVTSGSPKGVYSTLSALQSAFPSGNSNIYLVTADGKWYYWNGTAWTAGGTYQSTAIAAKSVTSDMIAPILSYSIVYGNPTELPIFSKSGTDIIITMPSSTTTLYILDDKGVQLKSLVVTGLTFTLKTNQMLIWNTDDNQLVVLGNNVARNTRNIVMISNYYGFAQNGFFKPYYDNWLLENKISDNANNISAINSYIANIDDVLNYSIVIGDSYPSFTMDGQNVTIIMPTGTMYLVSHAGTELKSLNCSGLTFTLKTNQMLIWNIDDNVVLVKGNNETRNTRNIVLLSSSYGIIQNGFFKPWYDDWILQGEIDSINDQIYNLNLEVESGTIPIPKIAKLSNIGSTQGLTIIKDEIWGFNGSVDDHSSYGNIKRYDVDTLQLKSDFTHNLGHAANADYNHLNDCIIVSNGTSDTTVLPRLDIIKNASSLCGDSAQVITYGTNTLSISFFTANKQIGGSGLIACFGEKSNIVYLLTGQGASPRKIFRCVLGTGTTDYSDKSTNQDDITAWGAFISGCGDNEFNGTAKITQSWVGEETDTYQGVCYHDGYLYLSVGNQSTSSIPKILKIKCSDNVNYKIVERKEVLIDAVNSELEGICVYKGIYLLTCFSNSGVDGLYAIPLYNKQVGKGAIGTRVTLQFPCNSKPNVFITPTSSVTDLYISDIDNKGFMVSSASGGAGTFNWECMID